MLYKRSRVGVPRPVAWRIQAGRNNLYGQARASREHCFSLCLSLSRYFFDCIHAVVVVLATFLTLCAPSFLQWRGPRSIVLFSVVSFSWVRPYPLWFLNPFLVVVLSNLNYATQIRRGRKTKKPDKALDERGRAMIHSDTLLTTFIQLSIFHGLTWKTCSNMTCFSLLSSPQLSNLYDV